MWLLMAGGLVVQAVVAAAVLGFTLATFDRRLGRTGGSETPRQVRPADARRCPAPAPALPCPSGGPARTVGHPSEVGSRGTTRPSSPLT